MLTTHTLTLGICRATLIIGAIGGHCMTTRPLLPKPFTPSEIRTVVREALRQMEND